MFPTYLSHGTKIFMKIVISCADPETLHSLDIDRKVLIVSPKNISHIPILWNSKIFMKTVISCADPETLHNLDFDKKFLIVFLKNIFYYPLFIFE